jgi:hypothetical protein
VGQYIENERARRVSEVCQSCDGINAENCSRYEDPKAAWGRRGSKLCPFCPEMIEKSEEATRPKWKKRNPLKQSKRKGNNG